MLNENDLNVFHMVIFTFDGRDEFHIIAIDTGHIEAPISLIVPSDGIHFLFYLLENLISNILLLHIIFFIQVIYGELALHFSLLYNNVTCYLMHIVW